LPSPPLSPSPAGRERGNARLPSPTAWERGWGWGRKSRVGEGRRGARRVHACPKWQTSGATTQGCPYIVASLRWQPHRATPTQRRLR